MAPAMILLFSILMGVLRSSNAHTFYVGEDDGWILRPSENYSHWARRYRFEINDEFVFKYKKGHDSVLVVNKNDYTKCNKENPIKALKNGDSKFKLEKSGPFFFISGHEQNCEKGQKLNIIVLSPKHHHQQINITIAPSHSPAAKTPARVSSVKPPSYSPSPSPAAKTPTHAPQSHSPAKTHAHAPDVEAPSAENPGYKSPVEPPSHSPSPSPVIKNQTHAPSHSVSPTHAPLVEPPSHGPSPSPVAKTLSNSTESHSHSPSPSPGANTPPQVAPAHALTPYAESPKNKYGAHQPDPQRHHIAAPLHLRLRHFFGFH